MKQGTSLVKNSSQTVEIKDKTSPEMKIVKQGKNSSQTVEIKDKTNEKTAHEKQSTSVNNQKQSTHYELTPVIITKNRNK